MIDEPRAVRAGEELDVPAVEAFLRSAIPGFSGPLTVRQFRSGHSNLTYLLEAGGQEWVLRRPPHGAKAIQSGHDMGREYEVLRLLHPLYPLTPRPIALSADPPFYVMERVRGLILRANTEQAFPMREISEAFIDNLAALHAVDWTALQSLHRPGSYVERQVKGWVDRYRKAQTEQVAEVEQLVSWLQKNAPADSGTAVIHNDYKYDNVVLDPEAPSRIRAVLDWEMATVGDPQADLGTTLAYWIDPDDADEVLALNLGLTALPGNLSREALAARYAEKSGRPSTGLVFHYALALFKVAGIVQQLHYRYVKGFTKDERFAALGYAVGVLARQAIRAVERGRLGRLAQ